MRVKVLGPFAKNEDAQKALQSWLDDHSTVAIRFVTQSALADGLSGRANTTYTIFYERVSAEERGL